MLSDDSGGVANGWFGNDGALGEFMSFFGMPRIMSAFGVLCVVGVAVPAAAQAPADPSRIEERFRTGPAVPEIGAPLALPSSEEDLAPAAADAQVFQISGVIFEGNKTLEDSQLQAIASEYLNRDITFADIQELASRVTAAYRDAGYILTRAVAPPQRVGGGQLRIQVLEGFIDGTEIQGDAGGALPFLRRHAERIAAAKPLTADILERELLLAGDIAGFTVRSILTPSQTTPGAADLTLVVERDAFEGYAAVDNLGSRYLGREELVGAVFANDVFGTAGRLGFTGVIAPDGDPELAYGSVSLQQPLTSSGLSLFASVSYSETRPGRELELIDTKGQAKSVRVDLSYPIVRSRDLNVIGTVGFAASDVRSENFAVNPTFEDRLRSLKADVFVNALDQWGGFNTGQLTFTQGVTIFNGSQSGDLNLSRINADSKFSRLNAEVTRWQPIGNQLGLLVGVAGQTSFNEDLLAGEEVGFGGSSYGRGFDPSEIAGETGLAGKVEAQWFVPHQSSVVQAPELYTFYETATVKQVTLLPGEDDRQTIRSAGVGVRASVADMAKVNLYIAKPIGRDVVAERDRDARVFFSISSSF